MDRPTPSPNWREIVPAPRPRQSAFTWESRERRPALYPGGSRAPGCQRWPPKGTAHSLSRLGCQPQPLNLLSELKAKLVGFFIRKPVRHLREHGLPHASRDIGNGAELTRKRRQGRFTWHRRRAAGSNDPLGRWAAGRPGVDPSRAPGSVTYALPTSFHHVVRKLMQPRPAEPA